MLCVFIRIASSMRFLWVHSTYYYCVENRNHFCKLSSFASWPGTMINPQRLKPSISQTKCQGPKDVWAIEVGLYSEPSQWLYLPPSWRASFFCNAAVSSSFDSDDFTSLAGTSNLQKFTKFTIHSIHDIFRSMTQSSCHWKKIHILGRQVPFCYGGLLLKLEEAYGANSVRWVHDLTLSKQGREQYTPQPLYNTIVGVQSINRVS